MEIRFLNQGINCLALRCTIGDSRNEEFMMPSDRHFDAGFGANADSFHDAAKTLDTDAHKQGFGFNSSRLPMFSELGPKYDCPKSQFLYPSLGLEKMNALFHDVIVVFLIFACRGADADHQTVARQSPW
jgi:hypothetical protein